LRFSEIVVFLYRSIFSWIVLFSWTKNVFF